MRVPVLKNFNQNEIIGYMEIDENEIPDTPEYVFSIQYRVLDAKYDESKDDIIVNKHQLIGISLIPDFRYEELLNRKGT